MHLHKIFYALVKDDESSITQNANDITSKVSSSDVQNMLDNGGYATQSWTGSQIKQSADEINSTVTSVSNKVDNLQIGGRNYFLDSKTRTITPPGTTNWDWRINISDDFWSNSDRLKPNNIRVSFTLTAQKALLADFYSSLYFSASPWPSKPVSYPAGTTAPQKYELVFNITDPAFKTDNCFIRFQAKDTSDFPFILKNAKLEIGTTFTDWSPAPEDTATVTALSKVDQKADSISSTVTNNKSDADSQFTNINQTIGGIQSTVKNKADSSAVTQLSNVVDSKVSTKEYNSEITQLADDINLRVTKDGLISQINQQAGGNTLIQVSGGKGKLYFDSSSVVFSGKAFIPSAAITNISADKIDTSQFSIGNGSKYKIDMSGDNGVLIGNDDEAWNVSINSGTLHFAGSDNGQLEYAGGLDYTADIKNSNTNGFGAYVYTKQRLGAPYGGDYFAVGEALQKNGDSTLLSQDMIYAPNKYSGYLVGFTFNKEVFMNNDAQLVFTAGNTNRQPKLVFSGYKDSNAGIYMDTYGNITGNTTAQQWWVKDKNLNTVFGVDLNGNKKIYIGGIKFSGGSMYVSGSNGLWVRNGNGSLATINASNFAKGSTKESKKNIKKADIDKLATNIYNMDITTFNYKNDCSTDRTNIGAVIGDGYHIDDSLLTKNEDAIMIDNVVFALVATAQKQSQQISELTTELTALKIKEQNNE